VKLSTLIRRSQWDAFFAEGDEKGINLSLEVAIEMARRTPAGTRPLRPIKKARLPEARAVLDRLKLP
jgi:hypothetical protein